MVLATAEDANRARDFDWFLMPNSKRVVGICERARISVRRAQTTKAVEWDSIDWGHYTFIVERDRFPETPWLRIRVRLGALADVWFRQSIYVSGWISLSPASSEKFLRVRARTQIPT